MPLALLIAGIVSARHGAKHHLIPVVREHEEEVSIPIPMPFVAGPPGPEENGPPGDISGQEPPLGPDGPPGGPLMDQPPLPWQPPQMFEKVIKKVIETTDEPEPRIIREVSVGGVTLADSGEIRRTYSGEDGPALCPT